MLRVLPFTLVLACAGVELDEDDLSLIEDAPGQVPPEAPPGEAALEDAVALEEAPPPSRRRPLDEGWEAWRDAMDDSLNRIGDRRLYIQVDRPLYQPGDTVWLKSWDVAASDLSGGDEQGVTYTLLDPRGGMVAQKYVKQSGGTASNDFVLPAHASGGIWTLRARTDRGHEVERPVVVAAYEPPRIRKELTFLREAYGPGDEVSATVSMLGADGEPLRDHPIRGVITVDDQALRPVAATTDSRGEVLVRFTLPETLEVGDGLLTVQIEQGGVTEAISRAVPITLSRLSLGLFPEGGALVEGLESRVYFQAKDPHGQPADLSGRVLDDRGEVVARLRSVHHGLGRFRFTPAPGRSYRVAVDAPAGISATFPLPEAQPEGCVLRSYDDLEGAEQALRVSVRCSERQEVMVMGTQRGAVMDAALVMAGPDEPGVAWLTPEAPRQGVARVTVMSAAMEPLAERLVYRERDRALRIELSADKASYSPRDEVVLSVKTRDASGEPVPAEVALSVVDDAVLKLADDEQGNLLSRLYLEGELDGPVEDPGWYFDPEEEDAALGLDLLMGTAGYRRFERVRIVSDGLQSPGVANPDIGESAQAKREEGKVGRKETKMQQARGDRVAKNVIALDREIAEDAGVMGALAAPDQGVFGQAALSEEMLAGIGGLIGAKGAQIGAGGLGARGAGVGGGGGAVGLGGLGARGLGAGASGFGAGGGAFGAKQETGGLARVGGDPIVLGALDKSLIDVVIKRHMNAIRYCYQRELTKDPTLAGKIVVKFVIHPGGTVSSATTRSSTMGSPAVEQCINGRFMRMQFPETKGGGIVIVSYPFLFSNEGFVKSSAPSGPRYAYVRAFPIPRYGDAAPAVRSDFRETVLWAPEVRTDERGEAEVRFTLSDATATFKVTAEGVGGAEDSREAGRAETELTSALPFDLFARLPDALSAGDRLLLPVTLSNNRERPAEVSVFTELGALLTAAPEALYSALTLTPGEKRSLFVPVEVGQGAAESAIAVSASAEALSDQLSRTVTVSPRGFPRSWSASGELDEEARFTVQLGEPLPGSASASVTLYPSALADMISGLEGMLRQPHGCFEQTSSANYPNVMALTYLEARGLSDAGTVATAREYLTEGYGRLIGYESPSGGFDWWGRDPGHEELTAYGLQQFADMSRVYPVDTAMVARTGAWLAGRRDGEGGYRRAEQALHRFGRAAPEVTAAYVTYSLVQAGYRDLPTELAAQAASAKSTDDPYLLALAALSLLPVEGYRAQGAAAAARLAGLQGSDGAWDSARQTITDSGAYDRTVETTGLALLALMQAGVAPASVERGVSWLRTARRGSTWGATQATVLALKAITEHDLRAPIARTPGSVAVLVDGEVVASLDYTGEERGPLTVSIPAQRLAGSPEITLQHSGEASFPYSVQASWTALTPASDPAAPLELSTALSSASAGMGDTVRLSATVENRLDGEVSSPMVRLGLPAGARAQTWQLKQLAERGEIASFETRPREVILYLDGMLARERRSFHLDLSADVPGEFTAPPSSAYLYYDDQRVDWEGGLALAITP